jgi:hypothetical protein
VLHLRPSLAPAQAGEDLPRIAPKRSHVLSLVHREQLIDGGLVVEQVVRRAAWKYELRRDLRNLAAANFLDFLFFQAMR